MISVQDLLSRFTPAVPENLLKIQFVPVLAVGESLKPWLKKVSLVFCGVFLFFIFILHSADGRCSRLFITQFKCVVFISNSVTQWCNCYSLWLLAIETCLLLYNSCTFCWHLLSVSFRTLQDMYWKSVLLQQLHEHLGLGKP